MIYCLPKRLRQSTYLSQKQPARLLRVDRNTISSYENSVRQPSLDTLSRIADVFGISTDYLFGRANALSFDIFDLTREDTALLYNMASKLTTEGFANCRNNKINSQGIRKGGAFMPLNDRGEQGAANQSKDGGKVFIPAKPKVHFDDPAQIFGVCAYCRVSTDSGEQLSSFELQQAHYWQLVKERPNWELKHVYADEGISGTSLKNRTEFNAIIAACEKEEYDLVVTKSVSRFARNLVDLSP